MNFIPFFDARADSCADQDVVILESGSLGINPKILEKFPHPHFAKAENLISIQKNDHFSEFARNVWIMTTVFPIFEQLPPLADTITPTSEPLFIRESKQKVEEAFESIQFCLKNYFYSPQGASTNHTKEAAARLGVKISKQYSLNDLCYHFLKSIDSDSLQPLSDNTLARIKFSQQPTKTKKIRWKKFKQEWKEIFSTDIGSSQLAILLIRKYYEKVFPSEQSKLLSSEEMNKIPETICAIAKHLLTCDSLSPHLEESEFYQAPSSPYIIRLKIEIQKLAKDHHEEFGEERFDKFIPWRMSEEIMYTRFFQQGQKGKLEFLREIKQIRIKEEQNCPSAKKRKFDV